MKFYLNRFSSFLAVTVICGGMLVLTGWQLDIEFFKRPLPGAIAMNPSAALCFIFAGISLVSAAYSNTKRSLSVSVIAALLMMVVPVLRIADAGFHTGIKPDMILFSEKLRADQIAGKISRMAPNSAISFILAGIALLLMHMRTAKARIVFQLIALLITFISVFSLLGYLYNVPEFRGQLTRLPMALHAAILFFILSLALLLAFSREGVMAELTGRYIGSLVARRFTAFGILVPVFLGFLALLSYRNNLFSTELGILLHTLSIVIIAVCVIWYNARLLNKRDRQNRETEHTVRENEMQIQAIFNSAPDAVIVIDQEGRILQWNPRAELMFGWPFSDVNGKFLSDIIIPARYREAHSKGMARYLQTGITRIIDKTVEIEAMKKDGSEISVALNISPTIHKGKTIFIGFIRDVTQHKLAQEKIRQSEVIFSTLFYKSPVMNSITDAITGEFIDVNESYASFCGLTREQMIGKTSMELGLLADPEQRSAIVNNVEEHKSLRNIGLRLNIRNQEKWLTVNVDRIRLFDRTCFLAAMVDITDQKKGEDKFRRLLELAPDAIVIVNNKGIIQIVNAQVEKVFGYSREELIGQQVEILMPLRYDKVHRQHRAGFFNMPKVRPMGEGLELFGRKKNGSEFPVEVSLSPLETDEGMLVTAAIRDMSEKKRLEKEIRDANANLEMKINQRTAELERKNRDLEQFAYVASHDLQEPLRTTSSFVQMLNEKYRGKLDEEADQILEYMVSGSERMKILIKDLLDYSRIGRKTELKDIDCNILLKEVIADLDTAFKEAEAMIEAGPLPKLRGYPTELKLLFQNLVSNALKFRRKDVGLVIRISATPKNNHWEFAVKDNGIGIEPKFKERIFVIFQRLHVQTEYEGSGIGLAHCKKIAELHNGTIWVDSAPGKGSTFYFTIQKM